MNLQTIDILALAQHTGVKVERAGRYFKASCPFHPDETPSLIFYTHNNSFYCFGCGAGGNVLTWVKLKYHYDTGRAFGWLEAYAPELHQRTEQVREMPPVSSPRHSIEMIKYWHYNLKYTKQDQWFRNRGFTDETIEGQLFGWDGTRYVIPVWEGAPGNSRILTLRLRRTDQGDGPKYLTPSGSILNFTYGRWHTRHSSIILMHAGELDAAYGIQDSLPSNSLVGGQSSFRNFPDNWPNLWYPRARWLLAVLDHKESDFGGILADAWSRCKGSLTADVIHWLVDCDDYNEFRMHHTKKEFLEMLCCQSTIACQLSQF